MIEHNLDSAEVGRRIGYEDAIQDILALLKDEEHPSRIGNPNRSHCRYYSYMQETDCDCGILFNNELRESLRQSINELRES